MALHTATYRIPSQLKAIFQTIHNISPQVSLIITKTGWEAQTMDSGHVSIIQLQLEKEEFVKYDFKQECTIGLNLEPLTQILKCAQQTDQVEFVFESDNTYLTLINGERQSRFCFKNINIDEEYLQIPDIDYQTHMNIQSKYWSSILDEATTLQADDCKIQINPDKTLELSSKGQLGESKSKMASSSITKKTTMLKKEDGTKERIEITQYPPVYICPYQDVVQNSYSLKYLKLFNKFTAHNGRITFDLTNEMPLKIKYYISPDIQNSSDSFLCFYLAPKIENED